MEIQFSRSGAPEGGAISNFLLEKVCMCLCDFETDRTFKSKYCYENYLLIDIRQNLPTLLPRLRAHPV